MFVWLDTEQSPCSRCGLPCPPQHDASTTKPHCRDAIIHVMSSAWCLELCPKGFSLRAESTSSRKNKDHDRLTHAHTPIRWAFCSSLCVAFSANKLNVLALATCHSQVISNLAAWINNISWLRHLNPLGLFVPLGLADWLPYGLEQTWWSSVLFLPDDVRQRPSTLTDLKSKLKTFLFFFYIFYHLIFILNMRSFEMFKYLHCLSACLVFWMLCRIM